MTQMVLQKILGNLGECRFDGNLDRLHIEWYETGKKILHKRTEKGLPVILKRLNEKEALKQDDVVFADGQTLIAIDLLPCSAIRLRPQNMYAMAQVVYEIGNKHLPLFYQDDALLVPFEKPLFQLLTAAGFAPEMVETRLLHPLKTSVAPHGHTAGSSSLFSRILQMTGND